MRFLDILRSNQVDSMKLAITIPGSLPGYMEAWSSSNESSGRRIFWKMELKWAISAEPAEFSQPSAFFAADHRCVRLKKKIHKIQHERQMHPYCEKTLWVLYIITGVLNKFQVLFFQKAERQDGWCMPCPSEVLPMSPCCLENWC